MAKPNQHPAALPIKQLAINQSALVEGHLYEVIAQELSQDIEQGLYKVGQKVPSVRKLSSKRGVSISTVNQAYSLLEDRGIIQAKPQSGYFVKRSPKESAPLPPISMGDAPTNITKGHLIKQILASCQLPSTVNFGAAIPDEALLPVRSMQTHLQKLTRFNASDVFNYQFSPGYEPLRQQIAQRMRNSGVRCHHDEVVITQGCTEALNLCLRANTRRGDTIAVESPCYYGFLQIAEVLGLKVIEIPTDPNAGMSIEALKLALQEWEIKLVLLNTRFSNPTGSTLSKSKQQQLVELINQHKIKAIEDDIYGELGYDNQNQTVLKTFDTQGRVLYCSSFTKTVAPGLRVGWCIPGESLEQVINLQTFNTLAVASLPQCAMASFLQNGHYDKHLRQLQRHARENCAFFINSIMASFPEGTRLSQPSGGFVLWVCLPEKVSALDVQYQAQKNDMAIMPGSVCSNTNHFDHYIRINYAMPWNDKVKSAIEVLGEIVCKLSNKVK